LERGALALPQRKISRSLSLALFVHFSQILSFEIFATVTDLPKEK
jgi:hypothetical protein